MASWAALNVAGGDARANLAEQRATEEAQDADNAAVYERALRCQQQRQTTEAKSLYLQLLSGHVHVSARLEYLCNKNVATMEQEAQSFDHALKYFAAALALDATDVVVWYQMATTALETGELWLARWTLEEGLKVDATYWPLVESLAQVLSQIGDEQEYQRVAQYLRQNDPHCATLKALDGQKKRARPPSARDLKLLKRTKKKLQHLREIADDGLRAATAVVDGAGEIIVGAFEENNRSEHADVVQTAVEIKVTFDEQEVEKDVESEERDGILEEKDEKVDANKQQTQDNPPPAKRAKHKETAKVLDTSLLTGISDNDTQDSGIYLSEVLELQPRRRKSRRHEERLREEHAAAVRKARELDLAYRLGAFLPDYIDKEDRESTPEVVSIEWLPLLNVELVGAEFIIADASKKTLSKTASFILSSTEGSANNTDLQSSQTSSRELTVPTATPHVECVSGRQISSFIHDNDAGKGSPRGVMGWIRHFLNHCGKWSNLKLGSEDEGIHQVCTWLEKALNGELDVARATTPTQSSVIIVADHSLTQSSRFEGNGLTLGAQLFLLELHFDTILQQPVRGKRQRTVRKLVETQLAQAQKLLFEFGWLEDSEETSSCPTGGEFLRLLWLIARMYERCGNPQMAQHYFIKCREKLLELNEGDVDNDAAFRVDLPNQKAENEITLAILDEKISGLRYSDVLSEARLALEVENTSEESYEDDRRVGVDAMARLLYVIRSLSGDEFRNLFTLSLRDDNELALSFPLPKRSALMTLCCTLMKEEEVTMARSDAKTPKQLFGNGAILFVLLFESFCRPDQTTWTLPSQLVELIHLLHGRLGRHGICSLTYFSETSGDSGKSSCFLETCTVLLSKFVQQKAIARDTAKSPSKSDEDSAEEDEEEAEDRFQNEVCQCYRCLYDVQILPGCKDTDGHKTGGKAKDSKEEPKEDTVQDQFPHSKIPIEEFATTYITQVIEFARRCFEMAARLAEEAVKKHKTKLQDKRDRTDEENDFDEELEDLQNKIIECNEECGLLLYNVLQEFSLMKELNLALFPRDVYSRLVTKTLAYFRRGLEICEANEEAHEDHFRLLYMIGKTLKKRRWCELRLQDLVDPEALATATEMADYFSKAEAARGEGDKEHALVHAFYSLQALRIDLTISESPSTSALRLVCSHFYEEEEEKDEEEDDESADSAGGDEKNSQETTASATSDTMKATSSKTKEPSDPHTSSSTRKDEVLALLTDAERDDSVRELNVTLARGWLALNIIEALESIPDEDRYFHPSRYVLARIVYWLSTFYSALEQSGYKSDNINALLDALQARRSENNVVGPSDAAARALKEMTPIFDKRRPQIVAIWFSEYIPTAKKFEELNQRQMKYDYYRLKYWRFYIALLRENAAYGRLKEVGSWVLACKEEHDVIDIMLGSVLEARGKVLRSRLQEFLNTAERAASERPMNMMTQTQLPGENRPVDALLKQLAKTYTYYLEVLNAQQRLAHVVDNCGLLLENAELPMVAVFFMGATKYPSEMPLLEKDAMILDRDFNTNVTVIMNALRRDELPPRIYDAQNREAWKAFLDAARSFCEDKWPERSGKGKPSKKHARPKTANAAAPSNVAAVATSPAVPNSSQSTPIGPNWKLKAMKLLREKQEDQDPRAVFSACTRAVSVTNDMVMRLIAVLRRMDITFYVAPYEADAQLAFLSRQKIVDVVISQDSDCVPYGVKTVLFKLGPDGWGSELKRRSLGANEELSFVGWTEEMKLKMLSPLDVSKDILPLVDKGLHFLGNVELRDDVVATIAAGEIHPMTHESYAWKDTAAAALLDEQRTTSKPKTSRTRSSTSSESSGMIIPHRRSREDHSTNTPADSSQEDPVHTRAAISRLRYEKPRPSSRSSWTHLDSVLGSSDHIVNFRSPKVSENFKPLAALHDPPASLGSSSINAQDLKEFESRPVRDHVKRVRNPANRRRDGKGSGFEGEVLCKVEQGRTPSLGISAEVRHNPQQSTMSTA
ncbi:Exonuclease 1 [Phytophthora cactorum]|nr:Exonuclease 1 [Phytophthora cactorum]